MRKIFIVVLIVVIGLAFILFSTNKTDANEEYFRIHIRANSNLDIDQNVKYKIKDKVVEYLIPVLCECETKEQAENALRQNFDGIEKLANEILRQNGFFYSSHAKLCNEYFPTRRYQDLTLDEGFYDALILELGEAKGDNWWCVVYPPLCFVSANPTGEGVVYKSKILHIINKILGREGT